MGIQLGSHACSRALSAWESRRNEPPEDCGEWIQEETTCYVNGKRVMSDSACGEEGTKCWTASAMAAHFWLRTKRGAKILEAYKELYGPFAMDPRGYICDQETMTTFQMWDPIDARTIERKAMQWAVDHKLIKKNVYDTTGRNGFSRTTVSIGGVKATMTSRPCEAPDYDPY